MPIRNVILDWSGTVVDDLTPVHRTTNHVLEQFGLVPMSLDEFRREFCLPLQRFYERRLPGVDHEQLEQMFMTHYPAHRHQIRPLAAAESFLQFCQQRSMPVFIASTVDPDTYRTQMQRFDLDRYITRAYLGIADKTVQIHRILDENRLDRRETVFVGDMEHDIEAGRAGGVVTCAVLTGYDHDDTLRAQGPDLVCADLGALQQHLQQDLIPAST
jgi:phosphoglycolate phosphatase-like HAD superfamily hydrolase